MISIPRAPKPHALCIVALSLNATPRERGANAHDSFFSMARREASLMTMRRMGESFANFKPA
jgi:hypothetical protein